MPQLKKFSFSRSNLLPKVELLTVESVYANYNATDDITSYVPMFSDTKSCTSLTSEAESDGADSVPQKPRKRQRLDHLSQEEKILRRKMKNRVAAQTARDRKKARMVELEEQVIELETERKMLMLANMNLQAENEALQKENEELNLRLGETNLKSKDAKTEKPSPVVTTDSEVEEPESRLSASSGSLEHAEGTRSATAFSLDDAVRLLTSDNEDDAFLDILQQYSDGLLQPEELGSPLTEIPNIGENRECEISSPEVVGAPSKSVESNKELIHFDHIYFKQEDNLSNPVQSDLSDSELSTKDCNMDISSSLNIMEADSSEIPLIRISESPASVPPSNILEFESASYPQLGQDMLSTHNLKSVPSPVSSDGGYDSSFSVSSPCSSAVNPWDDTLSELFPSLV